MIIAVIGAGGKTSLIHSLTDQYRKEGKSVLVTTSTHMYVEENTLLTDNPEKIIRVLKEHGYAMVGRKSEHPSKIKALSQACYEKVCSHADIVLIEADGSKHMPVKWPSQNEPVIYDNVDQIILVWGLHALGQRLEEALFRKELLPESMQLDKDTILTAKHLQDLLEKGYLQKMKEQYPDKKLTIIPSQDGSLYQRALASLLSHQMDVDLIKAEWFDAKPCLFICGGGHVAHEVAQIATYLDFHIKVMDDRPDFANPSRYPMAEEVICDSFDHLSDHLVPNAFYVVVTRGHKDDYQCVKTILQSANRYLGMIGSKLKVAKTMQMLEDAFREEGMPEKKIAALLDNVHAPIGLKIGASTPGEIAISILAEIIQMKSQQSSASISQELLESQESGMLCILIQKKGSSPRGVGSMMLVTKDQVIDTVGGGAVEYAVIQDARENQEACIREYQLNTKESANLGMICGGSNQFLFLPI